MADNRLSSPLLGEKNVEMKTFERTHSMEYFQTPVDIGASTGFKDDLAKASGYIKDLLPVMIETPFEGSSLVMTQDERKYVFGSRQGKLGVVDRDTKQVTLDIDLGQGSIWTMTLIENDKYILSAGARGGVKKILFSDLSIVDEFVGHTDEINFIQISKDERFMFTGSDDRSVRMWNLDKPASESRDTVLYNHGSLVYCVDLSMDERYLASCSNDCTVKVFNLSTREEMATLTDSNNSVWAVKISASNKIVVAGNQSGIAYVWKFGTWELERELTGHTQRIRYMDMAKDESFLVTAGLDHTIKVWDLVKYRKEITMVGHTNWVKFTLISKDQSTVFSCADDRKVAAWKIPKFNDQLPVAHPDYTFTSLDSSRNSAFGRYGDSLVGFDFYGKENRKISLEGYEVVSYQFSTLLPRLYAFVISGESKKFIEFNLENGEPIREHELQMDNLYSGIVFPSDKYIVAGEKIRVNVFNLSDFSTVKIFRGHNSDVVDLVASSDSTRMFSADRDGMIKVYNAITWEEVNSIDEKNDLQLMQISRDSEYLFTTTNDSVLKIWGLKRVGLVNSLPDFPKGKLYFTQDLDYFLHCTNSEVCIRDLDNFEVVCAVKCLEGITDFTLSADESLIMVTTGSETKVVTNPLKCKSLSIHGDFDHVYDYVRYLNTTMGPNPVYNPIFDSWVIEPFHINALHIFATFNKGDVLRQAITKHAPFFPSRTGHTPLSIAIERKFEHSIESVYKALKNRVEAGDEWAFYQLGDSILGLNTLGFENLHRIYEMAMIRYNDPSLPKFCSESTKLPITVLSHHPTIDPSDFPDTSVFQDEGTAIAFGQSAFRLRLHPGSQGSIELLESLLECENDKIYYSKLIQTILDMKWAQVRWFIAVQALVYLSYLVLLALYSTLMWEDTWFMLFPFLVSTVLFAYEGVQMYTSGLEYFEDMWNYVDISRAVLFNTYCIMAWTGANGDAATSIFTMTVLTSWLRGVTYFRIFERTRYLINLIIEASVDIVAFFVLLFYSTLAFALVLQSQKLEDAGSQTIYEFFLTSYKQNLGDLPENPEDILTWLLFFMITIVNPVIMLNLLISIMGDTYGRVKEGKVIADARELLGMIIEVESLMVWNKGHNEAYFIKIVCGESDLDFEDESLEAKVRALRDGISKLGENIGTARTDIMNALKESEETIMYRLRNR